MNVAFVDELQAGFLGNLASFMQSFRKSGRLVLELEIRVKGGEVKRNIGTEMREDPLGEFVGFRWIVVEGRDHKIGDFEPHIGFVLEPKKGVENGLKVREGDFAVEIFGEGFQIDVSGVDVVVDVVEGFVGDVAVGNHDGFQAEGL